MSSSLFQFKRFSVHQSEGVMKINTDGVLLAAHVECLPPKRILDIGTGTGVMALMLAQRFENAIVEAIDLNPEAAKCAEMNFLASPFAERLHSYAVGFEQYLPGYPYDLVVMNPPFFINALKNPDKEKTMARHAQLGFFGELFQKSKAWLTDSGTFQLIWPLSLKEACIRHGFLKTWNIQREVFIHSFKGSPAIRVITQLGKKNVKYQHNDFVIYEKEGVYAASYRECLQPFFLNF